MAFDANRLKNMTYCVIGGNLYYRVMPIITTYIGNKPITYTSSCIGISLCMYFIVNVFRKYLMVIS